MFHWICSGAAVGKLEQILPAVWNFSQCVQLINSVLSLVRLQHLLFFLLWSFFLIRLFRKGKKVERKQEILNYKRRKKMPV